MLTFGSLFAGIGGFDLGLERAGMHCRWQVEIDKYAQAVLKARWPESGRWDDVRTFPPAPAEDWTVDAICGGFPCQDISLAGNRAGIEGERSGLWFEYERIIGILRPRFVIVENVTALLTGGFDRVLGGLAALRYDAEWECLPAGAFGAIHGRDRIFVLACDTDSHDERSVGTSQGQRPKAAAIGSVLREGAERLPWRYPSRPDWRSHWANEPAVGRVAHGVSSRMDRLHGIGNAVVPQISEWIGRRIVAECC